MLALLPALSSRLWLEKLKQGVLFISLVLSARRELIPQLKIGEMTLNDWSLINTVPAVVSIDCIGRRSSATLLRGVRDSYDDTSYCC